LITLHLKIVLLLRTSYLERLNDFYGYCAKPNFSLVRIYYFASANLPIIYLVQIEKLFHHWESSKHLITVLRKFFDNFYSPIWKYYKDLHCYCAKPIFSLLRIYHFATAHLPIINLVQIDQICHDWESSKYLITFY